MSRKLTIVLGVLAAGLSLMMPAPDARASTTDLIGNLGGYTSPDIWEVTCLGGTQGLAIRAVAPTNTQDKYVAIATALSPRSLYGRAVTSEVFAPGGVATEVTMDRSGKGRMKMLVSVKQTGGNPGDVYYVNIDCIGSTAPPKLVLLHNG